MNSLGQKQIGGERAGFTLLEVLLAMVVFSISFLGFYRLQLLSVEGNANAGTVTTGAVFASDMIERIRTLDYDDESLDDDDNNNKAGLDDVGDGVADGTVTSDDGLYTVTWNVAEDFPLRNVKMVRVIVTKIGGMSDDKAVTLDYYKSKY